MSVEEQGRPAYGREDICTKRSAHSFPAYKLKTGELYTVHVGPVQAFVLDYLVTHPDGEAPGDTVAFAYPHRATQTRARITEMEQAGLLIKSNWNGSVIIYAVSRKGRDLHQLLTTEGWYA